MSSLLVFLFTCLSPVTGQEVRDYPIQPVPFTQVEVDDAFWAPKIGVNADVTIPYTFEKCETKGRIDNFFRAAGTLEDDQATLYTFDETDLYKVIEGASYGLQVSKNPALEKYLDTLIAYIAAAQEPDGYLFTFRTMDNSTPHDWIGDKRWEKVEDLSHELYNAGHMYEAAAAHHVATGKRNFLDIALKNADLLTETFGWGKLEKFPGHQEVELGLVKLYRITGKQQYLDLARFFLDLRGEPGHLNHEYSQSHIKVVDQHTAVGHSVRATYMYSSMADVAALTGDKKYLEAIDDIWRDVVEKKIYITGGIGATNNGEAFGKDYDLPNMTAYAETCAAIANVFWNSRMFLLHGEAKYIDVLERTLYNGLLSGVSLSGDHFFYPNPLESMGQHQRSSWHDCACCISNMTRFLPSVPGYVYAQNGNDLYLNLFVGSTSTIELPATKLSITQQTNYPWDGRNEISIAPEKPARFTLRIRIPGWANNDPTPGDLYANINSDTKKIRVAVNGKNTEYPVEKGYVVLDRKWQKGDAVVMELPMEVQKTIANANVMANKGRLALQRGPIVYCLESPKDSVGGVLNVAVEKDAAIKAVYEADLLNGVTVLKMQGQATDEQPETDVPLIREQEVTAIPYYAWSNRGPSEMKVWIPFQPGIARPKPLPTLASESTVTGSLKAGRSYNALRDGMVPRDPADRSASYVHWWPNFGTQEWVEYDFGTTATVTETMVYWFDDGPNGGCRLPTSWKVFYREGEEWLQVKNLSEYTISKNAYDVLKFEAVETDGLRLEMQLPEEYSSGLYEWKVR